MSILQNIYNKLNVNSVLTYECEVAIVNIFFPLISELKENYNILQEIYESDIGFKKLFPIINSENDIYESFLKSYVNLTYDQMFISDMIQTPKLIYWGIKALMKLNDSNYLDKYEILLPINYYDWSKELNQNGYSLLNQNFNYDLNTQELINKICSQFDLEFIITNLRRILYQNMKYNQVHYTIINDFTVSNLLLDKYIPFNIVEDEK